MKWPVWIVCILLGLSQLVAAAAGRAPDAVPETAAQTNSAQPEDQTNPALPLLTAELSPENPPAEAAGQSGADADSAPPAPEQNAEPLPIWRQGAQAAPVSVRKAAPQARPAASPGGKAETGQIRLFQTVAFRGSFDALPKWTRVLGKAASEMRTLNTCSTCPPGAASWQRILGQAKGQEPLAQLKMVNSFFNKWPYRQDSDAYGTSDWWATPLEFLKLSGDCEDYAIIKYFALRELGFSADDLRIVVLKDRIRGIGHAVLAVFLHGEAYVLDNLTDAVFPHSKYTHYIPQYSVNEHCRWSHVPMTNQP